MLQLQNKHEAAHPERAHIFVRDGFIPSSNGCYCQSGIVNTAMCLILFLNNSCRKATIGSKAPAHCPSKNGAFLLPLQQGICPITDPIFKEPFAWYSTAPAGIRKRAVRVVKPFSGQSRLEVCGVYHIRILVYIIWWEDAPLGRDE